MTLQIPGFYFDHAKQKYFRITPDKNSAAHTPAAKYSRSAIERQVEDARSEKKRGKLRDRRLRHSVVRSSLTQSTRCVNTLPREIGFASKVNYSELWATQYSVESVMEPNGNPCLETTVVELAYCALYQTSFISRFDGVVIIKSDNDSSDPPGYRKLASPRNFDTVKGLDTSHTNVPLLAGGTESGLFFVSKIPDLLAPYSAITCPTNAIQVGPIEQIRFDPSSANNKCLVAVAGVQPALLTICPSNMQYGSVPVVHSQDDLGTLDSFHATDQTLCVEWQTSHVVTWGCRNGGVDLADIRSPSRSLRLVHGSSVCKLRYVGSTGHHILAAGLRNKLAMYDLRWCPPPSSSRASPIYLTYPSYRNKAYVHYGFDVSSALELIAAANDKGGVTLFDLWSGTERTHRHAMAMTTDYCKCIRFVEEGHEAKGSGRCLVSIGNDVKSWIFG